MWLLQALGKALEWFKGVGTTTVVPGEEVHRSVKLAFNGSTVTFEVVSRRVVFTTRFNNRFAPSVKHAIFEVQGTVVAGDDSELDPMLKEKVVFPDLSSIGLSQTQYPHVRAISAYFDRVNEKSSRIILPI